MRATKYQRPLRKSERLEAIQHLKNLTDSKSQNIVQRSFLSNSTNSTRSSVCPLLALTSSIEIYC